MLKKRVLRAIFPSRIREKILGHRWPLCQGLKELYGENKTKNTTGPWNQKTSKGHLQFGHWSYLLINIKSLCSLTKKRPIINKSLQQTHYFNNSCWTSNKKHPFGDVSISRAKSEKKTCGSFWELSRIVWLAIWGEWSKGKIILPFGIYRGSQVSQSFNGHQIRLTDSSLFLVRYPSRFRKCLVDIQRINIPPKKKITS